MMDSKSPRLLTTLWLPMIVFSCMAARPRAQLPDERPALIFSTFLGGEGHETANDIAVDRDGYVYVTGTTDSDDFLGQTDLRHCAPGGCGSTDAFAAKLTPDGASLVYLVLLGGSRRDFGSGLAVDGHGNAYVTGRTGSFDFPTTPGAYQRQWSPGSRRSPEEDFSSDAFVAKLDPAGRLVYSTYIGGPDSDSGSAIAVDRLGQAHITGGCGALFPTTPDAIRKGHSGTFLARLSPDGTALTHSSCGLGAGQAVDIALDGNGNAYLAGILHGGTIPTVNAFQPTPAGREDCFIIKVDSHQASIVYSTLLGGKDSDRSPKVAVDGSGNAYLAGTTWSRDFPTRRPFQKRRAGQDDAFVAKFSPTGELIFSTFLGGKDRDGTLGLAVGGSGGVYLSGFTRSNRFLSRRSPHGLSGCGPSHYRTGLAGGFTVRLDPAGTPIQAPICPGGLLAVDGDGGIYVANWTDDPAFPTTPAAWQPAKKGQGDIFVVNLAEPSGQPRRKP